MRKFIHHRRNVIMKNNKQKLQIGKILIGLYFILLGFNSSFAQCEIKGVISEEINGHLIPFADVILYKNNTLITGTQSDFNGAYLLSAIDTGTYIVEVRFLGFATTKTEATLLHLGDTLQVNIGLSEDGIIMDEVVIVEYKVPLVDLDMTSSGGIVTAEKIKNLPSKRTNSLAGVSGLSNKNFGNIDVRGSRSNTQYYYIDGVKVAGDSNIQNPKNDKRKAEDQVQWQTEGYTHFEENIFKEVSRNPLSTFSIDVDAASYSNIRRLINQNQPIVAGAIRIEEMINYFDYEYPSPKEDVFGVHTSLTKCPWNPENQLLKVGIQGERMIKDELPLSNIVFLVDVSGSMGSANKLPLVKSSLKLLVEHLRPTERVAIVTYAGSSQVVLPSTLARNKEIIISAIDRLDSGGGTAGAKGIKTAYKIAANNFIKNGNNRVILATDGDFNLGVSSNSGLVSLIAKKRKSNIFLSVLGYGMGNYKDDKMQLLADKGNGNHSYIDNINEAKKVLVDEFGGTLVTIAKDMKIQIEFNPSLVGAYRLVGYENRILEDEDFNNDKKDAGELGSGHDVTALYEIIPSKRLKQPGKAIDPLKYQQPANGFLVNTDELATIKLRFKTPKGQKSTLVEHVILDHEIPFKQIDADFAFCLSVAEFGMILRDSKFKKSASLRRVLKLAKRGEKDLKVRSEFIDLVERYKLNTSLSQR